MAVRFCCISFRTFSPSLALQTVISNTYAIAIHLINRKISCVAAYHNQCHIWQPLITYLSFMKYNITNQFWQIKKIDSQPVGPKTCFCKYIQKKFHLPGIMYISTQTSFCRTYTAMSCIMCRLSFLGTFRINK